MKLRELLDLTERVRADSGKSATDLEVIIEDDAGIEFFVENVYWSEPNGIGFDIREKEVQIR